MDELNHDFQALALEGRAMGEVSELVSQKSGSVFKGKLELSFIRCV
jgi:hypothetical protein